VQRLRRLDEQRLPLGRRGAVACALDEQQRLGEVRVRVGVRVRLRLRVRVKAKV